MKVPRFVSVTRTGNENDIIEAFVRHHAALFDLMLVIDDDSTDGTWSILQRLHAEGLPVMLFRAQEMDWAQTELVTRLLHRAFDAYDADWVAPLDADEFIEPPAGATLADIIPATAETLFQLRWSNFAWHRTIAQTERNPVVRMTVRMPPRSDSAKVIVPRAALRNDREARLLNGNHGLISCGERVRQSFSPRTALCHYPIRSVQQFVSKAVINHLRYASLPNNQRPEIGFQYRKPFDLTKGSIEQMLPRIIDEMERESPVYALLPDKRLEGQAANRPLDYRGGALTYSDQPTSALTNIIGLAERFAKRIAVLEEGMGLPSGL